MTYLELGGPKPDENQLPYAYPGLVYWLDPDRWDDPTAPWQLNGTKVASAPSRHDRFGVLDSRKSAAQGTDSLRPTLNTSDPSYGGRATLTFANTGAGTGITLSTGQWASSQTAPYTVYVVGDSTASNTANQRWLNNVSATGDNAILLYHGNATGVLASTGITPTNGNQIYGDPIVSCHVVNGASSALYNKDAVNANGTGTESTALTGLKIGGDFASSACFYGRIATVLVYSGAHDATTRDTIMSWLKARYSFDRSRVPYQVGGLAYWLDPERYADGIIPWTMNSTKVATATSRHSWVGAADASKNVTQATDGNRPTINVADAAYNTRNTLSLNAASTQYLASGAWTTSVTQPFTYYIVGQQTNKNAWLVGQGAGSGGVYLSSIGDLVQNHGAVLGGTADQSLAPHVQCIVTNGASSANYSDNTSTPIISGNAGTTVNCGVAGIGIGATTAGAAPMTGKIATVLIYAGAHTAAQRALIMQWLGNYYGITVT